GVGVGGGFAAAFRAGGGSLDASGGGGSPRPRKRKKEIAARPKGRMTETTAAIFLPANDFAPPASTATALAATGPGGSVIGTVLYDLASWLIAVTDSFSSPCVWLAASILFVTAAGGLEVSAISVASVGGLPGGVVTAGANGTSLSWPDPGYSAVSTFCALSDFS